MAEYHQAEIKKLSDLRARYIANPMRQEPLDEALALRKQVRANFVEHFQAENLPCEPGACALHFWSCWFNADGNARVPLADSGVAPESSTDKSKADRRAPGATPDTARETRAIPQTAGFDGIIGNPPWEWFKPFGKEFAAKFHPDKPQFSKMGMDGPTFEKWFADELKTNKEFASRWQEYETGYEQNSEFFGRRFEYQGGGDYNLFKLFIEGDLALLRTGGRLSLLVPSARWRNWNDCSGFAGGECIPAPQTVELSERDR